MFHKVFSFFAGDNDKNTEVNANTPFYNLSRDRKNRRLKEFFSQIPRIETERLILRKINISDYRDMFEYSSDPEVTRYLTWYPHKNIAETSEYAQYLQKRYASGKFFDWGIEMKEDGKLIGTCGFTSIDLDTNTAEVGYVISRKYWGKGIVPEACAKVLRYGFSYFGFDSIRARFIDGNERSMKVMQKLGMTFEKTHYNWMHIKGEYKTIHQYRITKEKYFSIYQ